MLHYEMSALFKSRIDNIKIAMLLQILYKKTKKYEFRKTYSWQIPNQSLRELKAQYIHTDQQPDLSEN